MKEDAINNLFLYFTSHLSGRLNPNVLLGISLAKIFVSTLLIGTNLLYLSII